LISIYSLVLGLGLVNYGLGMGLGLDTYGLGLGGSGLDSITACRPVNVKLSIIVEFVLGCLGPSDESD